MSLITDLSVTGFIQKPFIGFGILSSTTLGNLEDDPLKFRFLHQCTTKKKR